MSLVNRAYVGGSDLVSSGKTRRVLATKSGVLCLFLFIISERTKATVKQTKDRICMTNVTETQMPRLKSQSSRLRMYSSVGILHFSFRQCHYRVSNRILDERIVLTTCYLTPLQIFYFRVKQKLLRDIPVFQQHFFLFLSHTEAVLDLPQNNKRRLERTKRRVGREGKDSVKI
ncbi:uncharacterized protein EI90DRAFT_509079 [Cantharellus anzutake]|uniref:uncharacterized protein n=1 Tax=Cantharellus anzutake TaxID=1750568 RepID=UPI001907D32A|nr:uncharacterized protein EI90DRAFT_509079 [Cantharellus anzutake]KAF8334119.1 hypothetical protein EI90DRAFT_509079 [Cantharellus anzutake]